MRKKSASKDWHPEDIKAAVRKTGVSLDQLSRMHGLPDATCRHALYRPSQRGEDAIAAQIGIEAAALWPSRFDENGVRFHMPRALRSGPKSTDLTKARHRQKGEAA